MNEAVVVAAINYADALMHAPSRRVTLSAPAPEMLEKIFELETLSLEHCEQVEIPTEHLIHAGMYARTITMPKGIVLTGALMKLATVLIVTGNAAVLAGEDWIELRGYNVIPASAGRKQVFLSRSPVIITMLFPTQAGTVEEAEAEITDQAEQLMSRWQDANTVVTTEAQ